MQPLQDDMQFVEFSRVTDVRFDALFHFLDTCECLFQSEAVYFVADVRLYAVDEALDKVIRVFARVVVCLRRDRKVEPLPEFDRLGHAVCQRALYRDLLIVGGRLVEDKRAVLA